MMVVATWLVAIMLILDFFIGASERNKENIILRPLDIEKSNLYVNMFDEIRKCNEEDDEFFKGVMKCDIDNTIEEFWDSVQTKLNVMSMLGISTDTIYDGLYKHISKMNDRGYVFKE